MRNDIAYSLPLLDSINPYYEDVAEKIGFWIKIVNLPYCYPLLRNKLAPYEMASRCGGILRYIHLSTKLHIRPQLLLGICTCGLD